MVAQRYGISLIECSIQYPTSEPSELNTQIEIPYLCTPMLFFSIYYFCKSINLLLFPCDYTFFLSTVLKLVNLLIEIFCYIVFLTVEISNKNI